MLKLVKMWSGGIPDVVVNLLHFISFYPFLQIRSLVECCSVTSYD